GELDATAVLHSSALAGGPEATDRACRRPPLAHGHLARPPRTAPTRASRSAPARRRQRRAPRVWPRCWTVVRAAEPASPVLSATNNPPAEFVAPDNL
ncbi:unnamed protein product, partial [Urochloa humidicola]